MGVPKNEQIGRGRTRRERECPHPYPPNQAQVTYPPPYPAKSGKKWRLRISASYPDKYQNIPGTISILSKKNPFLMERRINKL